jgi:hypothetical protein
MTKMVERKCSRCGTTFQARQADVNRGWARFCSKSCKAKKQTATQAAQLPKWLRDDMQFDDDLYGATGGWDEGGWLEDDSYIGRIGD